MFKSFALGEYMTLQVTLLLILPAGTAVAMLAIRNHFNLSHYILVSFLFIGMGLISWARGEWHLLKLFGMTLFPNHFLSNRPRFGEQGKGFWSSFNRRFDLPSMIDRLIYVALRTPPKPYRLLRMAEVYG
jgi:hypothetical protein